MLATAPLQVGALYAEESSASEQVASTVFSAAPLALPVELALIDATNEDRASHGVPPLLMDPELLGIARERAAAQLDLPSLSHYDSRGELVFTGLLMGAGITYKLAGENLARTYGPSDPSVTPTVEGALMRSPLHRKNILQPEFNRLAVGFAEDGNGRIAFAQIFRAAP